MMRTMRTFVLIVLAGALAAACGSSPAKSALARAVRASTTVAATTTTEHDAGHHQRTNDGSAQPGPGIGSRVGA